MTLSRFRKLQEGCQLIISMIHNLCQEFLKQQKKVCRFKFCFFFTCFNSLLRGLGWFRAYQHDYVIGNCVERGSLTHTFCFHESISFALKLTSYCLHTMSRSVCCVSLSLSIVVLLPNSELTKDKIKRDVDARTVHLRRKTMAGAAF